MIKQFSGVFLKNFFLMKKEINFHILTFVLPIFIVLIFHYILEFRSGAVMYLLLFSGFFQILELQRNFLINLVNENHIGLKGYFKVNGMKEFPYIITEILFYYLKGWIIIWICKYFLTWYPDYFEIEYLFDYLYLMTSSSINISLIFSIFISNPLIAADFCTYAFFGSNLFSIVYCLNNMEVSLWLSFIPQLNWMVLLRDYIIKKLFNMDVILTTELKQYYYFSIIYSIATILLYFFIKKVSLIFNRKSNNKSEEIYNGLDIKNLYKYYGSTVAVNNLSLKLEKKKINFILGPNGAGKSTLLNMVTGLINESSGKIYLDGKSVDNYNIGLCPSNEILFEDITVYQHFLIMSLIKRNTSLNKSELNKIMKEFDILKYKDNKVSTLSGGNKRKLMIALSLLGDIDLLVLDEPTSNIDPKSKMEIWTILKELKKRDILIIIASHSMNEVEFLSDNIVLMINGDIKLQGNLNNFKEQFGEGIEFKIENPCSVLKNITKVFPDLKSINIDENLIKFKIPLEYKNKKKVYDFIYKVYKKDVKIEISKLEEIYLKLANDENYQKKYEVLENNLFKEIQKHSVQNSKFSKKLYALVLRRVLFFFKNINQIIIYLFNFGLIYAFMIYFLKLDIKQNFKQFFIEIENKNLIIVIILDLISCSTNSVLGYFITYEKKNNIKNFLHLNNVSIFEYYVSTLVSDIWLQTIPLLLLYPISLNLLKYNSFLQIFFKYDDITFIIVFLIISKINFIVYSYFTCLVFFQNPKKVLKYFLIIWFLLMIPGFILKKYLSFNDFLYNYVPNLVNPFTYNIFLLTNYQKISREDKYLNDNFKTIILKDITFFSIFYIICIFIIMIIYDYYFYFSRRPGFFEYRVKKEKNIDQDLIDTNSINKEKEEMVKTNKSNLKLINVGKCYDKNRSPACVDINFQLKEGQTMSLLGQNGAGKTTIINILIGLIKRGSGIVEIIGKNIDFLNPFKTNKIGVCIQNDSMWENLSVYDHYKIYSKIQGSNENFINYLLKFLELEEYKYKIISELSSGNKRKCAFGLSLFGNPQLLLLDEFSCGIDIRIRNNIKNYLNYIKKEKNTSILLTTHLMEEAELLSDKITLIKEGNLWLINTLEELKNKKKGYNLTIKESSESNITEIHTFIKTYCNIIKYRKNENHNYIIEPTNTIFLLFKLEELKEANLLAEYDIRNLSLNDIFILLN